jgi:hypothetical protein
MSQLDESGKLPSPAWSSMTSLNARCNRAEGVGVPSLVHPPRDPGKWHQRAVLANVLLVNLKSGLLNGRLRAIRVTSSH